MLLWLVFALLSAGVLAVLLRPLLGPAGDLATPAEGATAVYRDQLAEIDAEIQRGQLAPEDAESARREIARRLLSRSSLPAKPPVVAASVTGATAAAGSAVSPIARRLGLTLIVLLPVAAAAIYLATGYPGLPAQPFAARQSPQVIPPDVAKLVAAVETRLKQNPADGRGWDVVAPVYLRLARYQQAADAYANAARLLGENPARLAGLAEASMMANDGRVTDVSRTALEKLLRLEPGNIQARFWLAYSKEQEGRLAEAAAEYDQLLASAPPDATWREVLAERREAVRRAVADGAAAQRVTTPAPLRSQRPARPPNGPSEADIATAERMSASERQSMIDAMVAGLAARLEKDGSDLAGWQRLVRALNTLGRKDEAVAALGRARKSFEGQPQPLAELAELARSLGLGS